MVFVGPNIDQLFISNIYYEINHIGPYILFETIGHKLYF